MHYVNVLSPTPLAGFHTIIVGRVWTITEVKFPEVPITDIIPENPKLAAKLTEADKKANGGNGDNLVQWEEAASALDKNELPTYVKFVMNHVPNPLLRAVDLYRAKAEEVVSSLRASAEEANNQLKICRETNRRNYPLESEWTPPYIKAKELAASLYSLIPSHHPASLKVGSTLEEIRHDSFFNSRSLETQWLGIAQRYASIAEQLEQLEYFLPR